MHVFTGEIPFGHAVHTFSVADNAPAISLTGTTLRTGHLYCYLYDSRRQLRASVMLQKPEKVLTVCADWASIGALPGELPAGEWQLHIYNVIGESRSPQPMSYRLDVTFDALGASVDFEKQDVLRPDHQVIFDYQRTLSDRPGWYRGDLHGHTTLSDGNNTLPEALDIMASQGLDFFFLTEHNLSHACLPRHDSVLLLPSIEVTADKSHLNVHGPAATLNMFHADYSSRGLLTQGIALKRPESVLSVNHAMLHPWSWLYNDMPMADIDVLEVLNDPTWKNATTANEQVVEIFTTLWNAGHRIYAVGGSDCHMQPHERYPQATEPSIYGDPATWVYAEALSGEAILAAIKNGHCYFERRCGLTFSLNDGALLPGDAADGKQIVLTVAVKDSERRYTLQVVSEAGILAEYPQENTPQDIHADMKKHAWIRWDIRREDGSLEGMINPVYCAKHPLFLSPVGATWGEVTGHLEFPRSTDSE
ncbi:MULTISPECIES: CehA/McbA family metallohydrolase [unclassified Cedecea]|uniref:CehA/McbA family metallohydrolase n=1 Tax=unclassified Cedecea TaxID=2649846 RepID=UPI00301B065E